MNIEHDFGSLRDCTLTAGLTQYQIEALEGVTHHRFLADQEVLIEEGATDHCLYIVSKGTLAVTRPIDQEECTTLHILRSGDLAGEMGFLSSRPHTATLRALGDTLLFSIEREALESLLAEHPWLVYRVMQNIVEASQDILRRMNTQHVELTQYIRCANTLH